MRLFIGMVPSTEAIAHAAEALDRRASRAAPDGPDLIASTAPDMRWVPPQRWHVTLAFLGEVEPDRIPRLTAALNEVAASHTPAEDLRIEGAGTFRGALWLGVAPTERHSPADRLARAVQRAARGAGVPVERRPWRAHLTVARWKPNCEGEHGVREAREALEGYAGPAFDVTRFTLVHSVTGPEPSYTDLEIFRLGPQEDS